MHLANMPFLLRSRKLVRLVKLLFLLFTLPILGCSGGNQESDAVSFSKQAIATGKLEIATAALKSALQQNPDNMEARWLLGQTYLEMGLYAAAEKELRRASELGVAQDSVTPLLARSLLAQRKYESVLGFDIASTDFSRLTQASLLAIQAEALLGQQSLDDAEIRLKQALELAPNAPEPQMARARLLVARGDWQGARTVLEDLLEVHREHAPAWSLLGQVERSAKDPAAAEAAFGQAIQYRYNSGPDSLARALVRIELGKLDEAQKDVDEARKRLPKYYEVDFAQGLIHIYRQDFAEAQPALEAAVNANDQFLPALFSLAYVEHKLGNIAQADSLATRYVASNPNHAESRVLLAQIRLGQDKFDEAEDLLRPVVASFPDNAAALLLLADAFRGQGKVREEALILEKLLTQLPDSAEVHWRLGRALLSQQNQAIEQAALSRFEQSLAIDPAFWQATKEIIAHHASRGAYEDALAVARQFLERNPSLVQAHNLMGLALVDAGDLAAAEKAFRAGLAIDPAAPDLRHNLAVLAIRDQRYDAAGEHYSEVLRQQPDHLETLLKLALLEQLRGRQDEMVSYLQQAIDAHPEALAPRVQMARHHLAAAQPDKAVAVLGAAKEVQRDNPSILEILGRAQLARRETASAIDSLSRLVARRPNYAEGHFLLSQAYAQAGDERQMERALVRTLDLDQSHFLGRLALAQFRLRLGALDEARDHLVVLKAAAADHPDVRVLEARIAGASGDESRARSLLSGVDDDVSNRNSMLALVQQEVAMGEWESGVVRLREWLAMRPDDLLVRLYLGKLYGEAGHLDAQVAEYQSVLKASPGNVVALNDLAWILADSQPYEALQYAEKAHQLAPTLPAVKDTLAIVLLRNGKPELALRRIEEATAGTVVENGNPTFFYHKALILDALGRKDEAMALLNDVLSAAKDFPERADAARMLQRAKGLVPSA